jgi:hypothetical protein
MEIKNISRSPLFSSIKGGPSSSFEQQHLKGERAPHKSFIPKGLGPSSYLEL